MCAKWLAEGKTPSDIFKQLKRKQMADYLVKQPDFLKWISSLIYSKNLIPEGTPTTFEALLIHYEDKELVDEIMTKIKERPTKGLIDKLLKMPRQGRDPFFDLDNFGVAKAELTSFDMLEMVNWIKYVNEFDSL